MTWPNSARCGSQKGEYGGNPAFKPKTIELFTQKQYETSRRGLGWGQAHDKRLGQLPPFMLPQNLQYWL